MNFNNQENSNLYEIDTQSIDYKHYEQIARELRSEHLLISMRGSLEKLISRFKGVIRKIAIHAGTGNENRSDASRNKQACPA